jgi:putative ATPase
MKDNLTKPLAEILRPKKVHDIVGQIELLGEGQSLKVAIEGKSLPSMILWGPPGVGKTSIAHVISNCIDAEFLSISAVLSGVKEIREAIEKAQFMKEHQQRNTILFVDEVHRFNKSQQDAFLPHIESGLITFIGATTENPSFEVNSALLSRCQVYVLKALNEKELESILDKALKLYPERSINEGARNLVVTYADGDARKLINLVEMLLSSHAADNSSAIDELDVKKIVADKTRRFDKGGDQFYDQISALHKSVRGSDPDAALYWLFKMLDGGADPLYLSRRIIRIAIEELSKMTTSNPASMRAT